MDIRVPLWRGRETETTVFFLHEPSGIQARLPKSVVGDHVKFLPFRTTIYPDGQAAEFTRFLLDVIAEEAGGRVSPREIWREWLIQNGRSRADGAGCVAGIRSGDVKDLFLDVFNAGERMRGRLDGSVQRVWQGYALVPRRNDPPRAPAGARLPVVTAASQDGLTQETTGADACDAGLTVEVPYEAATSNRFRYRLDGTPFRLSLYLDKDSAPARPPPAYRVTLEPVYE